MKKKTFLALCGALLALTLAATPVALAGSTAPVTLRVEGLNRTLLMPTAVKTHSGSLTRFGAPSGKCPDASAAGALDTATHHNWKGAWTSSLNDYEVTSILGETHTFSSKDFWDIFVNNVAAPTGACEIKLRPGEQLLFAAVPDKGTEYPLVLTAPHTATVGHVFTVKVVYFVKQHVSHPLAGVRVSGNGVSAATTNSRGEAKLHSLKAGRLILHATHADFVRSAPVSVSVS
jgi:hypothetical protein